MLLTIFNGYSKLLISACLHKEKRKTRFIAVYSKKKAKNGKLEEKEIKLH